MQPDEIVVPDVFGEITGFRAWKILGTRKLPLLGSATHKGTVWHPDRWTHATCGGETVCHRSPDRRVPGESCACGMYAARDRRHLSGMSYVREHDEHPVLIGEVGLAGKVIEGPQGWKAERARIKRLYVPFHHYRWIEPLAALYQVPVLPDNVRSATSSLEGR